MWSLLGVRVAQASFQFRFSSISTLQACQHRTKATQCSFQHAAHGFEGFKNVAVILGGAALAQSTSAHRAATRRTVAVVMEPAPLEGARARHGDVHADTWRGRRACPRPLADRRLPAATSASTATSRVQALHEHHQLATPWRRTRLCVLIRRTRGGAALCSRSRDLFGRRAPLLLPWTMAIAASSTRAQTRHRADVSALPPTSESRSSRPCALLLALLLPRGSHQRRRTALISLRAGSRCGAKRRDCQIVETLPLYQKRVHSEMPAVRTQCCTRPPTSLRLHGSGGRPRLLLCVSCIGPLSRSPMWRAHTCCVARSTTAASTRAARPGSCAGRASDAAADDARIGHCQRTLFGEEGPPAAACRAAAYHTVMRLGALSLLGALKGATHWVSFGFGP